MRIITVKVNSRNQLMELKGTEAYINFSVTDYINHELKSIIEEHCKAGSAHGLLCDIHLDIEIGDEF